MDVKVKFPFQVVATELAKAICRKLGQRGLSNQGKKRQRGSWKIDGWTD